MYYNYFLYIPFILYLAYSSYLYTKNKSRKNLFTNIWVAVIIQCMIMSIYSTYREKKKKKRNINNEYIKSCILDKTKKNKKNVRFNSNVKIRFIENRFDIKQ